MIALALAWSCIASCVLVCDASIHVAALWLIQLVAYHHVE